MKTCDAKKERFEAIPDAQLSSNSIRSECSLSALEPIGYVQLRISV